jgi:NTE family protein
MPIERSKAAITRDPILVDLALQGGGSHGAFTWGVLDRLLEEPWLGIDGISGTSAGAMNAAVLVDGHAKGGADGARTALENFWRRVSEAARFSPLRRGPLDVILGRWTLDSSPIYVAMDLMSRLLSPYDLNPMGGNPLRAILAETIDFERLAQAPTKLFITATNVRTGRPHVFKNSTVTPDVLLASACLPTMFQAIEIDGDPYWDGGYSGNPTITPLVRECKSQDTILVQINPVERERSPRSASDILNRLNEVSFNAVLLKELRMIAVLRQVADPGNSEGALWAGMRIHRIASDMLTELGASSQLNAEWEFFTLLHRGEGPRKCFWIRMHRISGIAPRWTSTPCWNRSDAWDFSANVADAVQGFLAGLKDFTRACNLISWPWYSVQLLPPFESRGPSS